MRHNAHEPGSFVHRDLDTSETWTVIKTDYRGDFPIYLLEQGRISVDADTFRGHLGPWVATSF